MYPTTKRSKPQVNTYTRERSYYKTKTLPIKVNMVKKGTKRFFGPSRKRDLFLGCTSFLIVFLMYISRSHLQMSYLATDTDDDALITRYDVEHNPVILSPTSTPPRTDFKG